MKFETLIKNISSQSISVVDSKVNSLRCNNETRTTVRAYADNKIGVAGQIGKADLTALRAKAEANLAQGIPYPCIFDKGIKRHEDNLKTIIPQKEFVARITTLLDKISQKFPNYCFDNKIELKSLKQEYTNDEGADLLFADNSFLISLTIRDKKLSNIMDLAYGNSIKEYDEEKIISDISSQIVAYENKIELPKEELPILVDEGIVRMLLKDIIAEYNMNGASLLSGKLTQKVFSDKLNIAAKRSYNKDLIVPFFDDEGVINENDCFDIVKDGVLTGLLATKRSSAMFNIKCSGTSNSQFDAVPSFGIDGLTVINSHEKLAQITDKGIYIAITSGGDITPDGMVGLPVQLAYLYENGKLTARLPEFMLSGNIFDILGDNLKGSAEADFFNYGDIILVTKMNIKTEEKK